MDLVFTNPRPDCERLIKEGSISIEQWDSSDLSKVARIKYLDDIIDEPTQYHNVEKLKVLLT